MSQITCPSVTPLTSIPATLSALVLLNFQIVLVNSNTNHYCSFLFKYSTPQYRIPDLIFTEDSHTNEVRIAVRRTIVGGENDSQRS
jgi:hypothetical protein